MRLHGGRYRWERGGWLELLTAGACAIGAAGLAVWQTLGFAFFMAERTYWLNIFTQIADLNSSLVYPWALFLIASFSVGVSCCSLAIVWLRAGHPEVARRDRMRAWLQAVSSFAVSLAYLNLQLRILIIGITVGSPAVPSKLSGLLAENLVYVLDAPEYPLLLLACVLLLGYSLIQARASLRGLPRAPQGLLVVLVVCLLSGGGATLFWGPPRAGQLLTDFGFVAEDRLSEEEWAVVRSEASSKDLLERYCGAFGPSETPLLDKEMRHASRRPDDGLPCRVCILPRIPFLALRGMPILLDRRAPEETAPGVTLELLGYGDEYRLYPTDRPEATEIKPIGMLGADLDNAQWVVLKAHVHARGSSLFGMIDALHEQGVRKISLSGVPMGVLESPGTPALLAVANGEA